MELKRIAMGVAAGIALTVSGTSSFAASCSPAGATITQIDVTTYAPAIVATAC